MYEIQAQDQTVYAQQKGKWAVIADNKEHLSAAPADPLKLLGEMPKNYDLAVRLSAKNAPPQYREQVLTMLRAGVEMGMVQQPNESDDEYAMRVHATKQSLQRITDFVNDLEDVMLGWNVDPSASTTHLDFELTAQSGTKLADQFAQMKPAKTDFAGFLMPEAALSANWAGTLSDADVAAGQREPGHAPQVGREEPGRPGPLRGGTEAGDAIDRRRVRRPGEDRRRQEEGRRNGGPSGSRRGHRGGRRRRGRWPQAGEGAQATGRRACRRASRRQAKWFKLNADSHQGVRFHTLSIPTPKDEMKPFVGDTLEVVVGIADDKLMVAAGRDAAEKLKKAIDQSKAAAGKEVPPLQISLAATAIAKFVAAVAEDEQVKAQAAALAAALEQAGGKDHVQITATPISRGVRVRLELEEGLLKAICSMGKGLGADGRDAARRDAARRDAAPDAAQPLGSILPEADSSAWEPTAIARKPTGCQPVGCFGSYPLRHVRSPH